MDLVRDVKLQIVERESSGYVQAFVTVPKDFIRYFEWSKGEELEAIVVLGSDELIIRRSKR